MWQPPSTAHVVYGWHPIVLARGEFSMTCIIATGSSSAKGGVTKFITILARFPIDYTTNSDEYYSRITHIIQPPWIL